MFSLKIRVPDRLLSADDEKCLVIGEVTFGYDSVALRAAVDAGTMLSWRVQDDERGWRAFVSFDHKPAARVTLDMTYGAVGLDRATRCYRMR